MPHSQYNRAILIVQCVTLTKVKRLKGCLEVVQPFYAEHSPEPSNVIVECNITIIQCVHFVQR